MFRTFLEISLAMSIVILFIIVISKFLDNKYKIKWRYFIWFLITIRLLVPINYIANKPAISIDEPKTKIEITVPILDKNIESTSSKIEQVTNEDNTEISVPVKNKVVSLSKVLEIIWKAGIALSVLFYLINYIVFNVKIKKHLKILDSKLFEKVKNEMKIKRKIEVYRCDLIASPMCIGFIKPKIMMPYIEYTNDELELIFKHELTHLKRFDIWYKLLLVASNIVHWFNPFVYIMRKLANRDIEYTCDDIVTRNLSLSQRKEYSRVILKTMERGGM